MQKTVVVLTGPTAVGKTELSLLLAEFFDTFIVNADSRQIYKGIPIGTAVPTLEERKRVKHFLVEKKELTDYYSASKYEQEAIEVIEKIFKEKDIVFVVGGSMLYIDALCNGIDQMPTIDEVTRKLFLNRLEKEGLQVLLNELSEKDPVYFQKVDKQNQRRVLHALEVIEVTQKPYSSFLNKEKKKRPFQILKIGLNLPRQELFNRINLRVDKMMQRGFLREVNAVSIFRAQNALNTVGYKELFKVLDKEWDLKFAVERIKKNTRVYAKKQLTWLKRDDGIEWFTPDDFSKIKRYILAHL